MTRGSSSCILEEDPVDRQASAHGKSFRIWY